MKREAARNSSPSEIVEIQEKIPGLTRAKKRVASYLLDNIENALFMSANQIAEAGGVDTATVVRTAQSLGYVGFPQLQHALRKEIFGRMTPLNIMKNNIPKGSSIGEIARQIFVQDADNIRMLSNSFDDQKLTQLVRKIYAASRILIVGFDLAACLAMCLEYVLQALGFAAVAPIAGGGRLRNQLALLKPDSMVIAITFRRGLRESVEAVRYAKGKGVYTAAITDSFASPLVRFSDMFFLAPVNSLSFASSFVAPLSLINAIGAACAQHNRQRTLSVLREIEREYQEGDRWY